jgi:hypothetical protein
MMKNANCAPYTKGCAAKIVSGLQATRFFDLLAFYFASKGLFPG